MSEGFSSNWPYISYKGLTKYEHDGENLVTKHFQILFNAANMNELIRIPMPDDVFSQPFSYVTDTSELYIICEYEDRYQMIQVFLEEYEDMKKHEN